MAAGATQAAELAIPPSQAESQGRQQQQSLERAVRLYQSGKYRPAQAAFEQLARAGVLAAHHNLAVMHLRHEIRGSKVTSALRHLRYAAEGGFVTSQYALGELYENGQQVPRDLALAMQWYELAATSGSVEAQIAIGTGFYLGRGRPQDDQQALQWYLQAARAGDVGAQYLAASMYESGAGTPPDLRLASYWYDAAARQGDPAAAGKREELSRRMTAEAPDSTR